MICQLQVRPALTLTCALDRRHGGPHRRYGHFVQEKKYFLPLQRIEHRFLGFKANIPAAILITTSLYLAIFQASKFKKSKAVPLQACTGPTLGVQEVEAPRTFRQ